jgi:hypothetical protein
VGMAARKGREVCSDIEVGMPQPLQPAPRPFPTKIATNFIATNARCTRASASFGGGQIARNPLAGGLQAWLAGFCGLRRPSTVALDSTVIVGAAWLALA